MGKKEDSCCFTAQDLADAVVKATASARNAVRRRRGRKIKKRGKKSCCDATAKAIQRLNIPPTDEQEYAQWLNHQRELKIVQDRYYPTFQQDWGSPSLVPEGPTSASSTFGFVTVWDVDVNGYFAFGIIGDGLNGLDLRMTLTDIFGTSVTITNAVGVGNLNFTDSTAGNFFYPTNGPPAHVLMEIRTTFLSADHTYQWAGVS